MSEQAFGTLEVVPSGATAKQMNRSIFVLRLKLPGYQPANAVLYTLLYQTGQSLPGPEFDGTMSGSPVLAGVSETR